MKKNEWVFKVQLFWKGHKNLAQSSLKFWHYKVLSKPWRQFHQIFVDFSEKLSFTTYLSRLVNVFYERPDKPGFEFEKKTNNESLEFHRTIKCWYAIRTFLSRGATLYIVFQMLWNFKFIVGIDAFELFHGFFQWFYAFKTVKC